MGFPGGAMVKNLLANARDMRDAVRSLGGEKALEKEMATHSSIIALRILWTVSPWGHKELDMTE